MILTGSNFHENVGYVVNGNLLRFIERKEVEPQPYDDCIALTGSPCHWVRK